MYNGLGADFIDWGGAQLPLLRHAGRPYRAGLPARHHQRSRRWGYDDNLVVKAENTTLWAIGGPGYKEVMKESPLDKAGLHVIFMPSINSSATRRSAS